MKTKPQRITATAKIDFVWFDFIKVGARTARPRVRAQSAIDAFFILLADEPSALQFYLKFRRLKIRIAAASSIEI